MKKHCLALVLSLMALLLVKPLQAESLTVSVQLDRQQRPVSSEIHYNLEDEPQIFIKFDTPAELQPPGVNFEQLAMKAVESGSGIYTLGTSNHVEKLFPFVFQKGASYVYTYNEQQKRISGPEGKEENPDSDKPAFFRNFMLCLTAFSAFFVLGNLLWRSDNDFSVLFVFWSLFAFVADLDSFLLMSVALYGGAKYRQVLNGRLSPKVLLLVYLGVSFIAASASTWLLREYLQASVSFIAYLQSWLLFLLLPFCFYLRAWQKGRN